VAQSIDLILPSSDANPVRVVTVVVPTYNEHDNIQRLVEGILGLGPNFEIIIVDDNSPDGTGQIADLLALQYGERIQVIHRAAKAGIGRAYLAGFALALERPNDLIAQMDADLSHDPADLANLVAAATSADLVLGSRYVTGGETRGWPGYRKVISRFGGIYARKVLGAPISDLTGGFKVYRRAVLANIGLADVRSDGYVFQIETTYRAIKRGHTVVEVPIVFADRIAGKSKLSRRIVFEAMIVVWRLRFDRSIVIK